MAGKNQTVSKGDLYYYLAILLLLYQDEEEVIRQCSYHYLELGLVPVKQ